MIFLAVAAFFSRPDLDCLFRDAGSERFLQAREAELVDFGLNLRRIPGYFQEIFGPVDEELLFQVDRFLDLEHVLVIGRG